MTEACSCDPETFLSLLGNVAHWEFELFLMLVVDGLVLSIAFPFLWKRWRHHCTTTAACPPET